MKMEELKEIMLGRPSREEGVQTMKKWYKKFIFSYAKFVRIEDGKLTEDDNNRLELFDFSLVLDIVESRKAIKEKQIISGRTVDVALENTEKLRSQIEDTLVPIIDDLKWIVSGGNA